MAQHRSLNSASKLGLFRPVKVLKTMAEYSRTNDKESCSVSFLLKPLNEPGSESICLEYSMTNDEDKRLFVVQTEFLGVRYDGNNLDKIARAMNDAKLFLVKCKLPAFDNDTILLLIKAAYLSSLSSALNKA